MVALLRPQPVSHLLALCLLDHLFPRRNETNLRTSDIPFPVGAGQGSRLLGIRPFDQLLPRWNEAELPEKPEHIDVLPVFGDPAVSKAQGGCPSPLY